MDPTNPLRGPRRAARRGEEALRYDRVGVEGAPSGSGSLPNSLPGSATATPPPSLPFPTDAYQDQFNDLDSDDDEDDSDIHDTSHIPNARAYARDNSHNSHNSPHNRHIAGGLMAHMARLRASRLAEAEAEAEATAESQRRGLRHPHRQRQSHPAGGAGYEAYDDDDDDDDSEEQTDEVEVDDRNEETDEMDNGQSPDEYEFAGPQGGDSDESDEEEEGDDDDDDELHGPEGDDVDGVDDVDDDDAGVISFDPMLLGLKEINNLAHFSVSSHKPGNSVEELLNDDLNKYWQSDGPQPHLLTIHFLRRVEIRAIRFFVDYNQDESYTPTSVVLSAGTGHHDLLEFASLALTTPVGWQEIDLSKVGGGADGQSLCCWIVQIKVKENHQNGKDTHIRGIKLYAIDENAPPADTALDELARIKTRTLQLQQQQEKLAGNAMVDKEDYLFERLITQPPDKLPGAPERSGSMATFLRDEEIR
ncbi:hypothetical protein Sste5346_005289 [Sporothrix stenoceras]|uniref:DOC domain-containing protein n=1 Tax=Sporothrix stenoceras TaxID=5173 RepID=A0ABR3Z5D5_9PEZI